MDNRIAMLSFRSPRNSQVRDRIIDEESGFSVKKLIGSYRVYERQTWVAHHTTSSEPSPVYRRRNRTKNIQTRRHNHGDEPTKIQIAWRGESFSFSARNAPPPKPSDKTQDSAQRQARRRKSITLVTEVPATDTRPDMVRIILENRTLNLSNRGLHTPLTLWRLGVRTCIWEYATN